MYYSRQLWLTLFFDSPFIVAVMASPGSLKQSLADALGLSDQVERIDLHLRNLREAGLISKAKTGRGAAAMGPEDAANLLVAVAASELVKDSVTSVEKFGSLKADPASVSIHGGKALQYEPLPLLDLPEDHKFIDAVRKTLTMLGTDSFFDEGLRRRLGHWRPVSKDAEFLFVRFFLPYDAASVFYGIKRRYHVHLLYGSLPVADPRGAWDLRNIDTDGRLLTLRIVDKDALSKIGKVIATGAKAVILG